MGKGILTEELVKKAITLAAPSINAVLAENEAVRGARWVVVVVSGPDVERVVIHQPGLRQQHPRRGACGVLGAQPPQRLEMVAGAVTIDDHD
jgi:hypothetical protein